VRDSRIVQLVILRKRGGLAMNPIAVTLIAVGSPPTELEARTHALKNCAAVILGLASSIERHVDPTARPRATQLLEATRRLKELLTYPLKPRSTSETASESVRIEDVLRLVSDRLSPQAESRSVLLATDCAGGTIHGDITDLTEALYNLASNALQASPPGSTVQITTRRSYEGDHEWTVEDAGCGIPASMMSRLGTVGATTRIGGTGLGLSLASQVITQHNGIMSVESTGARGTTVRVWLPGRRFDAQAAGSDATSVPARSDVQWECGP
jgi:signal transduction histidine kinase